MSVQLMCNATEFRGTSTVTRSYIRAGFSVRFRLLLSLLQKSRYVGEMDPQPSTFHKVPAT